nr:exosortase F system-associated protein [Nonlabens marinus]
MGKRIRSSIAVIIALLLLVAIRFFETALFYDPLHDYFHDNFQALPFPEVEWGSLLASYTARYVLNSAISLVILWFLYKSKAYLKAGLWVYLFSFVLLMAVLVVLLQGNSDLAKMALFYTRRFLIHPIFLFILVAGCYYLKTHKTDS